METLEIKNFCGIKHYKINVKNINIFIGNQGTGKSVTAKLLYFFKSIPEWMYNHTLFSKPFFDFKTFTLKQFVSIFQLDTSNNKKFEINYTNDKISYKIAAKNTKNINENSFELSSIIENTYFEILKEVEKLSVSIENKYRNGIAHGFLNDSLINVFNECCIDNGIKRYHQQFIPSGRAFFANFQNNFFKLQSDNYFIDYFIGKFGALYEDLKVKFDIDSPFYKKNNNQIIDIINKLLLGTYKRENYKDYLVFENERQVDLSFVSSGQQEVLPLIIVLTSYLNLVFTSLGNTIYIEEPETHLFPESQKLIVELMAAVYNQSSQNVQFVITTHSPYILSSFNNLILAKQLNDKSENVKSIVPEFKQVDVADISVYGIDNKKATDLIDKETGLIGTNFIDSCSELIADEFNSLLECTDEL